MAAAFVPDVDFLPSVFAAFRGVERGGLGDYCFVSEWIWRTDWGGGADFPVILLVEFDEDERNIPCDSQFETVGAGKWSAGRESSLGGFAPAIDASATVGTG